MMEVARNGHAAAWAATSNRNRKVRSLGTLTTLGTLGTLDAIDDQVSDTDSEACTEISKVNSNDLAWSNEPVLPEDNDEQNLEGFECYDALNIDQATLEALGFSDVITVEPLLSVPSQESPMFARGTIAKGQPPEFKNLFWRQYLATRRPPGLTEESLRGNQKELPLPRFMERAPEPATAGEWLADFKARARCVPVLDVSRRIFGEHVGPNVADFIGDDMLADFSEEDQGTSASDDNPPDGKRVKGPQVLRLVGQGRCGFLLQDDATISTPVRSPRASFGSDGAEEDVAVTGAPALARTSGRPFDGFL